MLPFNLFPEGSFPDITGPEFHGQVATNYIK